LLIGIDETSLIVTVSSKIVDFVMDSDYSLFGSFFIDESSAFSGKDYGFTIFGYFSIDIVSKIFPSLWTERRKTWFSSFVIFEESI